MKLYNDQQRDVLLNLPLYLILTTATVDETGPVSFLLEAKAGLESIRAATEVFAGNALLDQFFEYTQALTAEDLPQDAAPAPETLLALVDEALQILGGDPDGPGYRTFLTYIAEEVANESGQGFWGRGQKVSGEEAQFLTTLKRRLG